MGSAGIRRLALLLVRHIRWRRSDHRRCGQSPCAFWEKLRQLEREIRCHVPRTCSFSVGSLHVERIDGRHAQIAYRQLVAQVDRALFDRKTALRERNTKPRGDISSSGPIVLELPAEEDSSEVHAGMGDT